MNTTRKLFATFACTALLSAALMGCAGASSETSSSSAEPVESTVAQSAETAEVAQAATVEQDATDNSTEVATTQLPDASGGVLNAAEQFTERDLQQGVDTSAATQLTLADGQNLEITEEGVYVVSGQASEATIRVEAADTAKVQIVLDNVSITNSSTPAIYVVSADKVFVTLQGENTLAVTGRLAADGDTNVDGAVFAKDDLALNGEGSLSVSSTASGISSKDDLKITGGTYRIDAAEHALEANDSIRIAGGSFTLNAGTDGLHCANDEDPALGYVYLCGGEFGITAGSDGIEASSVAQIDGGTFAIQAAEGIEATFVQVNEGVVGIAASDDGINAVATSTAYDPTIEINGGQTSIEMAQGDTDALDSNGSIYINGGTVDITAQFAFDFIGEGQLNGGTVTVNGEQVSAIQNSMMGGGMGGMGGGHMGAAPMDGSMPEGAPAGGDFAADGASAPMDGGGDWA